MKAKQLRFRHLTSRIKQKKKASFNTSYNYPGSKPGTLLIEANAPSPEIALIDYSPEQANRTANLSPEACAAHLSTDSVSWIDVAGLGHEETLQQLGKVFNLHPLILEDIVNVPQRPKIEEYQDHLVIITQMVVPRDNNDGFWNEQVSFVLGKNYLLSVQELPERDCFKLVRQRIRENKGTIRQRKADYLAYALWDAVIDGFFPVLEAYGDRIEELEDEVVFNPSDESLSKIYAVKRELLALRRAIWSQREALNILVRDGNSLIGNDVSIYLKDCYDHTVQVIDTIESYRELASGLMDVYLSAVSNKMNEIMKLLTIVSSIFIPLTFIAGVYGMNFNSEASPWNMPELNWYWGYPFYWLISMIISVSLVYFFWRQGWFKSSIKRGFHRDS
ncbi:MAG: magnesium/cobalt transporter CorA [Cyanobacteria bacterium P01_G01_bin.39]